MIKYGPHLINKIMIFYASLFKKNMDSKSSQSSTKSKFCNKAKIHGK